MKIQSNQRIFVTGKTGSGKTVFVTHVLWPQYTRRVFWDIKLEQSILLSQATLCKTPNELSSALKRGYNSILYQPENTDPDDFNAVCKIIYDQGNFTLIVDEVTAVSSPSQMEKWHKDILMRGRSRGVGIINITQRPRACHNTILSEAEHAFVFRLKLETDVDKLKHILTKDYLDMLPTLPYYACVYSNEQEVIKLLKPIKI